MLHFLYGRDWPGLCSQVRTVSYKLGTERENSRASTKTQGILVQPVGLLPQAKPTNKESKAGCRQDFGGGGGGGVLTNKIMWERAGLMATLAAPFCAKRRSQSFTWYSRSLCAT